MRLLKNSIPAQLLDQFRQSLNSQPNLDVAAVADLKELFDNLKTWQQPPSTNQGNGLRIPFIQPDPPVVADLVTLGDYWLASAIEKKLIQPLEQNLPKNWQQLPPRWQELVRRNEKGELDASGKVWGAPYSWGSTVIVYRRDKLKSLGLSPTDWSDLWNPQLRDRISLLDNWREVIGLTLKYLGHSYNTPQLDQVSGLKDALLKLNQQVKFYSSDAYLQSLIMGDTWLAVGWSTDVLQLIKSEPHIAAVVPKSGTALWADLWVRSVSAKVKSDSGLASQWIDFCWQPKPAMVISRYSHATSPVLLDMKPDDILQEIRENNLLMPDAQILQKSEFLYPLPKATTTQYINLWKEIRQKL